MNLFNSEKDLVWRLVNAVLLIWVLASVIWFLNSAVVENIIPSPDTKYSVYRDQSCRMYDDKVADEYNYTKSCKKEYNNMRFQTKTNNYRSILGSVISLTISGGALIYLNLNNKTKKKK